MNRRKLMAGGAMLIGQASLPGWISFGRTVGGLQPGVGEKGATATQPPQNLLSSTFTPALLAHSLQSASAWHPYPRASEREAWQSVPEDVRRGLIARADSVQAMEWPVLLASSLLEFQRNGNRSRFEQTELDRRARLIDLVLGECAAGDGRFLATIADGVWLICEESFWGVPAHLGLQRAGAGLPDVAEPVVDLFAAETAATLAWVVYLVGDELTRVSPLILPRVRLEAKRRVLDPALERDDFWWMGLGTNARDLNNWNPWINSNWLATNLLLEERGQERLRAVLKICRSLDAYLNHYSPDGGCEEGPSYWQRAAVSYFECCWTLRSATGGGGEQVLLNPFLRRMGRYIADLHIAGTSYVNYGDAHVKDAPSPELAYRFGSAVNDPDLQAFGAFYGAIHGFEATGEALTQTLKHSGVSSLPRALADPLGVAGMRRAPRADALFRDSWYPALGLMTAREQGASTRGFYLAMQAAANGRSHGHNDSGSFILYHDGQPIFIDVGVEQYTAKTFSPERYSIWTMQSAFHNLPTIGGVMQSERQPYRASEIKYAADDARAAMSLNLATAYPPQAAVERWSRAMTLERTQHRIVLTESFALKRSATVELSFMSQRAPDVSVPGKVMLRRTGDAGRGVALLYDGSQLQATTEKIVLEDKKLQDSWGAVIHRLRLTSAAPITAGDWKLEVVVA